MERPKPVRKIGSHQQASAETIDALTAGAHLNMHVLGPGEPAVTEWTDLGLPYPDLDAIRVYRLDRVRQQLIERDLAGILLYDPLNVRYATDSTNMQLWITHNAARYCFVGADGKVILWDYVGCEFLSAHLPLITEIRPAVSFTYFLAGGRVAEQADRWAGEIADVVTAYDDNRIAVDHLPPVGFNALATHGLTVVDGEEVMEHARSIKSSDEIDAMRCAVAACETSIEVMRQAMTPGMTEQRLWSYLHAENVARGGEWIETRIMSSGPRTNPWFQEVSSRPIEYGDIVAFDTDLIGPFGYCVDMSRTWVCGDAKPTSAQLKTFAIAKEQIDLNTELLRPGTSFYDLTHKSFVPPPEKYRHYSCIYHGVGLCDEYPDIYFAPSWEQSGYDGVLEAGMVICVESYVGPRDGGEGVKLENQVLITERGPENLTQYPIELQF